MILPSSPWESSRPFAAWEMRLAGQAQTQRASKILVAGRPGQPYDRALLGRRAQQLRPGLRVLYMTGYSRNAVVHHGRLDEGVELLEKPIIQNSLAARVRTVLDRSAAAN